MIPNLLKFTIILFLFQGCGISTNIRSEPIFRHVNLERLGEIKLGDNVKNFQNLTDEKNGRFFLKENVFGGAKSIELGVDAVGTINTIIFEADESLSKSEKISAYTYLGKPSIKNGSAIWNDSKTRFVIYERPSNTGAKLYSKITDLNN